MANQPSRNARRAAGRIAQNVTERINRKYRFILSEQEVASIIDAETHSEELAQALESALDMLRFYDIGSMRPVIAGGEAALKLYKEG